VTDTRIRWAIAFLIGLSSVTAATLGWRAAQIGSTAAYDDRQSISETIAVEQARVERADTVAGEAREYERYRADYAVAAALDREANRLAAQGKAQLAAVSRGEAAALRQGATRRAATAGVFGRQTIGTDLITPTSTPRSFDYKARARALEAEESASLDSPGSLDPDGWAKAAVEIRDRIRNIIRGAFFVLLSIFFYALAEVSRTRRATFALAGTGIVLYAASIGAILSTVFF
jgi:hypothetical protein